MGLVFENIIDIEHLVKTNIGNSTFRTNGTYQVMNIPVSS